MKMLINLIYSCLIKIKENKIENTKQKRNRKKKPKNTSKIDYIRKKKDNIKKKFVTKSRI